MPDLRSRGVASTRRFASPASLTPPKWLLAMPLLLATLPAAAGCGVNSCTGVGAEAVVSVYPNGSGNIYLEAPADTRANLNCTLVEGRFMVLRPTHVRFREMYAALLFGLAAGKTVAVRISEGSSDCGVSYIRVMV